MRYGWLSVARVLHVLSVVIWIGGITAVTTVIFPVMRRLEPNDQKVWLFEQVERRFRPQARIAWLIVGLSGLYMLYALGEWARFEQVRYWWMHAMVALWLIFGLMLFVVEPLAVGPRLERMLATEPTKALVRIETLHWMLLVLSLMVIAAAVAGTYGWL